MRTPGRHGETRYLLRSQKRPISMGHPALLGEDVGIVFGQEGRCRRVRLVVRLDLTVPEGEIVVNRDHREDLYVALRSAFDAARRQLDDYARRQRGEVKMHGGHSPRRGRQREDRARRQAPER